MKTTTKISLVLIAFCLVATSVILTSCSKESKAIKIAKSSTLFRFKTPLETLAKNFFGNPKWESGETKEGDIFVNISGKWTLEGVSANVLLQYFVDVDKKKIRFNALEFDEEPQTYYIYFGLLAEMYTASGEEFDITPEEVLDIMESELEEAFGDFDDSVSNDSPSPVQEKENAPREEWVEKISKKNYELGLEYEKAKNYIAALASYYDAVEDNDENSKDAFERFVKIENALKSGKPGLGDFSAFEIHDNWIEIMKNFERYFTKNFTDVYTFEIGTPDQGNLDYENRTIKYSMQIGIEQSKKFNRILRAIREGCSASNDITLQPWIKNSNGYMEDYVTLQGSMDWPELSVFSYDDLGKEKDAKFLVCEAGVDEEKSKEQKDIFFKKKLLIPAFYAIINENKYRDSNIYSDREFTTLYNMSICIFDTNSGEKEIIQKIDDIALDSYRSVVDFTLGEKESKVLDKAIKENHLGVKILNFYLKHGEFKYKPEYESSNFYHLYWKHDKDAVEKTKKNLNRLYGDVSRLKFFQQKIVVASTEPKYTEEGYYESTQNPYNFGEALQKYIDTPDVISVYEEKEEEKRNAPPPLTRNLQLANPTMNGEDVELVQNRLYDLGFTMVGEADGWFGKNTERAVKRFQREAGMEETGIVDSETYNLLFSKDAVRIFVPLGFQE